MNKKILAVLSVCVVMGLSACGGTKPSSEAPTSSVAPTTSVSGTSVSTTSTPAPSSSKTSSVKPSTSQGPVKDKTGHIWGANADVAADATAGTVAYKRATCTENDKAVKYTVNQSVVTYASGSSRKSGTPEGYTKLTSNNQSMSFKFKSDKFMVGKMYLFGCMDAYDSNLTKTWCYYNGAPNVEVKVNGNVVDVSAQKAVTFQEIFGDSTGNDLSAENYALLGDVVITKGVNEIVYKRVATLNILIKDFVFVGEETDAEWGQKTTVAAGGEGYVGYDKTPSALDSKKSKLEIRALDGTYAEGSKTKDGTEEGYLKLNSNGNSISWKFKYGSAAIGELYQVGFMDAFSSNTTKTYANTNSSDASVKTFEGNFRVKINGNVVDKSAYMNINFEDLTKDGEALFAEEKNYSPVTLCPIGKVVLKNGDNELSYERLGSFNFAVSTFVLIVTDNASEYTVETTLSHDNTTHYNKVTGTDVLFNRVEHVWEEDTAQQNTPSTCTTHGSKHVKCTCGATSTQELPLAGHNFADKGTSVSDGKVVECGTCHATGYEFVLATPTKLKADVTWNITGLPAGNYTIHLNACAASTTLPQKFDSRYQFKVDSGEYIGASDDNATYASYGLGTGEAIANVQWSNAINTIAVGSGAQSFTLHWTNKGYSAFIAAVRLVKVA